MERSEVIIGKLYHGNNVALVSDAGTPGISDPGAILVQRAAAADIRIEPIPGPSSLTAALSVSGLSDNSFIYIGFAPSRRKQRRDLLLSLCQEERHLVFFEAPHRLQTFLQDCYDILGDRKIFWCRELTKMHEELTRDILSAVLDSWSDVKIKGESVLIISGAAAVPAVSDAELADLLKTCKKTGKKSMKDAVQEIARKHSLSRSHVYRMALQIWGR